MKRAPQPSRPASGFTLAEVAVTLLIVGMCLMYVLQGLNTSRLTALHTYQKKVAREMAALTFGHIEAGLYWDELYGSNDVLQGTYAEEGYEDYMWEVAFGEEQQFSVRIESDNRQDPDPTDTYRYGQMLEEEQRKDEGDFGDELEDVEEPFEKVRVRVVLETETETRVLITLERWIPWTLVYGEGDEDEAEEPIE